MILPQQNTPAVLKSPGLVSHSLLVRTESRAPTDNLMNWSFLLTEKQKNLKLLMEMFKKEKSNQSCHKWRS